MIVTYDKKADAAYIYFTDRSEKSAKTYPCDPLEVKGMINLDFNSADELIGVEVLGASKRLPKILLDTAKIIG